MSTGARVAVGAGLARARQLDPVDVAAIGIASLAAGASYAHGVKLLTGLGESWIVAHMLPLTVDALAIVCLVKLRTVAGWFRLTVVWIMFGLALAATLTANWLAAKPVIESQIVALWPPVCLLAVELVRMATAVTIEPVAATEVATALAALQGDREPTPAPGPPEPAPEPPARPDTPLPAPPAARRTSDTPSKADRVRLAHAEHPDWTQVQLAEAAGCDVRTVRRALATPAPAEPAVGSIHPDEFVDQLTGDQP